MTAKHRAASLRQLSRLLSYRAGRQTHIHTHIRTSADWTT